VSVVDTKPPVIACNAPGTISPSGAPVTFMATATDTCDSEVVPEITGFRCTAATGKGKRIDKAESCIVTVDGTKITIWDSGGVGDRITWGVRAGDDTGNTTQVDCAVDVVNKNKP
jgi:hypothetical protein